MAKFYGTVGFVTTVEKIVGGIPSGVFEETIIEKQYYGDIVRDNRRYTTNPESTNDNLLISNNFSIIADKFVIDNLYSMRYIVFGGAKWKIDSVELQTPRVIITTGGVYNGETTN